jgi:CheY-like chemotaxis protein
MLASTAAAHAVVRARQESAIASLHSHLAIAYSERATRAVTSVTANKRLSHAIHFVIRGAWGESLMREGPILIVEDDRDIRDILTETLQDSGFSVVTAVNGLDALRVVRSLPLPPAVILLDLMMPVMDGYGFLEERRKDTALAAIPVAIVTAGQSVERGRIGDEARVVRKPIEMPLLLGVLDDLRSEETEMPRSE